MISDKIKLLYVDDEVLNLQVLQAAFRQEFEIDVFTDPGAALEATLTTDYHMVIADQRMPLMTGIEFLEQLASRGLPSVRILLTGYTDIPALVDAINKGKVFYYVSKPWSRDELRIVFMKALDHYMLIRRNRELLMKLQNTVGELETFIYRASHDLRSPISTQLGLLYLIKQEFGDRGSDYIIRLEEVIAKLERLIQKMNQLSLYGSQYIHQHLRLNLLEIWQEILNKHSKVLQTNAISLTLEIPSHLNLNFDPEVARIIFENVLENALHFVLSVPTPAVTITAELMDQGLSIRVADNGPGIQPSELDKIYHPFYRGMGSQGNGLGLYLVRRLCEEVDGDIQITSDGTSGTQVQILLPVREETTGFQKPNQLPRSVGSKNIDPKLY